MKAALIQMKTSCEPQENLARAKTLINNAERADLIVLPEAFVYPFGCGLLPSKAESARLTDSLRELAATKGALLAAGTIPEVTEDGIYNTCFFIDGTGTILGKYRKTHLFDVNIPGKLYCKESDRYTPGHEPTVIQTEFGGIGFAVCYDLRFPELFITNERLGAKTIILPAAFSAQTGPAYWELLLRARACDSQCTILACAPADDQNSPFRVYGHSLAAGPDGRVLARAGSEESVLYVHFNADTADDVREAIPLLSARRPDVYSIEQKS